MFGIGPMELVLIVVVALLVFGPKRVPELARTVGRGLAEFRRASNDLRQSLALDDLQRDIKRDLAQAQSTHRPTDRPAQAGDDVPAGKSAAPPHPGELPLGNDHEHHDPSEEIDESEGAAGSTAQSTPPTTPLSPPPSKSPAQSTARPADPGLGSVPVSDTPPTDPERG